MYPMVGRAVWYAMDLGIIILLTLLAALMSVIWEYFLALHEVEHLRNTVYEPIHPHFRTQRKVLANLDFVSGWRGQEGGQF